MLEMFLFRQEAVFASTATSLFRIAGNSILRGRLQEGLFVEEIIGTAYHNQTNLWSSAGLIGG